MIVAMKDEVKDYRDNYHEAFKKLVHYYRILVVLLNCNLLNVLNVYIDGLDSSLCGFHTACQRRSDTFI